MLAARNIERSEYVVPWISSVHFGYPESEANAVIRGMDLAGHTEFARRATGVLSEAVQRGGLHHGFDPQRETVTFVPAGESVVVQATY